MRDKRTPKDVCGEATTRSALVLVTKDSLVSLRTYLNNKKQRLLATMSRM